LYATQTRYIPEEIAIENMRVMLKISSPTVKMLQEALFYAVENGHLRIVDFLCGEHGVKRPGVVNRAVFAINAEMVSRLLEYNQSVHDVDQGFPCLYTAVYVGSAAIVRSLLEHKADPNCATDPSASDSESKSSLRAFNEACRRGHHEIVLMLLEHKADIDGSNSDGNSGLTLASFGGFEEIVVTLLQNRANINHKTKTGETALHIACHNGRDKVASKLLEFSPTLVDTLNKYDEGPLFSAAGQSFACQVCDFDCCVACETKFKSGLPDWRVRLFVSVYHV